LNRVCSVSSPFPKSRWPRSYPERPYQNLRFFAPSRLPDLFPSSWSRSQRQCTSRPSYLWTWASTGRSYPAPNLLGKRKKPL